MKLVAVDRLELLKSAFPGFDRITLKVLASPNALKDCEHAFARLLARVVHPHTSVGRADKVRVPVGHFEVVRCESTARWAALDLDVGHESACPITQPQRIVAPELSRRHKVVNTV